MLKWHHYITLLVLTGDLQNDEIGSKPSAIPKSPKLLHIFHLYEYFPWWHGDDDFTIHLMKNRSNDSDWSESSPISNKLQTMKLLSHICNSCLMTQWYIDSHVLVPSSADSLALLSVISVCWTVIQHPQTRGATLISNLTTWLKDPLHCSSQMYFHYHQFWDNYFIETSRNLSVQTN